MPIIKSKPTSPGRRFTTRVKPLVPLHKGGPHKPLLTFIRTKSGRNNQGKITVRHQGGKAHKTLYRLIDFKRNDDNIPANVKTIEYDPNRSAYIALICYINGKYSYIIAPKGLKPGMKVISGIDCPISIGNSLPLYSIPTGIFIHCIEMKPGKGAQLARSAGCYGQIMTHEEKYTTIKLKSGFIIKILSDCKATIGEVSNSEHNLQVLGKAGAKRWRGIRPTVRGVAMNPVDHPHGGGEGKTSGGRHPVSPWGKKTKGLKTRNNKRTQRFIVKNKHAK
jgi:large subunit ribosomal protein L2